MEAIGILYLAILFIACFVAVHAAKLAWIGFKSVRAAKAKPREEQKPEQKKEEKKPPEPVYYIGEKKRKRAKADYSAPREIKFREDR